MKREEFRSIVRYWEPRAARRPRWYRMVLAWWGLMGYAALVGWILLAVTCIGVTVLGLIIGTFHGVMIYSALIGISMLVPAYRALWVQLKPPGGHLVSRSQAKPLWETIDRIASAMSAPKVDHILLTPSHGAAAVQHRRFALIGRYKNIVICGLPLMLSMGREQFEAVLAHELAHLSRSHCRFGNWVHRVNVTWELFCENIAQNGRVTKLVWQFANWYLPNYAARSLIERRRAEYEADRLAAQTASPALASEGLLLSYISDSVLAKFWDDIDQHAISSPQPPVNIYADIEKTLESIPEPDARRALAHALSQRTGEFDTHPSLRDRLVSIGQIPGLITTVADGPNSVAPARSSREIADAMALPVPGRPNAARVLLDHDFDAFVTKLESEWRHFVSERWAQRHRELVENRKRLNELEKAQPTGVAADETTMTPIAEVVVQRGDENPHISVAGEAAHKPPPLPAPGNATAADLAFEQARLAEDLEGPEQALAIAERALAIDPRHPAANYLKGRILLTRNHDDAGIACIELAMELDPDAVEPGCGLIYHRYASTDRHEEAEKFVKRYDAHRDLVERAHRERSLLNTSDQIDPHGLELAEIHRIIELIRPIKHVRRVWIARKRVEYFPTKPAYMFVAEVKVDWWRPTTRKLVQKIADEVSEALRSQRGFLIWVLSPGDGNDALLRHWNYNRRDHVVFDRTWPVGFEVNVPQR